jgi:GNAT superfamily N-acetyltransferase
VICVRAAQPRDAEAAVEVVRRSIVQLCTDDHQDDPATLARWLSNKTPEHFLSWMANADNFFAIAESADEILGASIVNRSGEISLFYLAPRAQRRGVGTVLHAALEEKARSWGVATLRLESTANARRFYEALGYVAAGDAKPHYGVLRSYPYEKTLEPAGGRSHAC